MSDPVAVRGVAELQVLTFPMVSGLRLVRETAAAVTDGAGVPFRSPADVRAFVTPYLECEPAEAFGVVLLNAQHVSLSAPVIVTRGLIDASLVHPREVFRAAILAGASSVVLFHNHPSGDPSPSADDRAVTRQIVEAGRVLGIAVFDHLIVGNGTGNYVSFAEAGLL